MPRKSLYPLFLLLCVLMALPLSAQEGHPLGGTWIGTFGTTKANQDVTVVMEWTGKQLTGMLNPGPNSSPLQKFTEMPDSRNWTVHFEADAKDKAGKMVHYVVDGSLRDTGHPDRKLVGAWMAGTTKNTFTLTRQ